MFAVNFLSYREAARRKGGNAYEVQMSLGHGTLEMVKPYLSLADADLENAHGAYITGGEMAMEIRASELCRFWLVRRLPVKEERPRPGQPGEGALSVFGIRPGREPGVTQRDPGRR